jgi:hypothetical protein
VRGDGQFVFFGYPEANEHDPERAIRAGLELVKSVRELETRPDVNLDSRVGIATGEVVVGDVVAANSRKNATSSVSFRTSRHDSSRPQRKELSSSPTSHAAWSVICSSTRKSIYARLR